MTQHQNAATNEFDAAKVTGKAYWRDLKDATNRTKSQIKVHTTQQFDQRAKKKISLLCGTIHRDVQLKCIKTDAEDFYYLATQNPLAANARQFFRRLNAMKLTFDGLVEPIRFTRE